MATNLQNLRQLAARCGVAIGLASEHKIVGESGLCPFDFDWAVDVKKRTLWIKRGRLSSTAPFLGPALHELAHLIVGEKSFRVEGEDGLEFVEFCLLEAWAEIAGVPLEDAFRAYAKDNSFSLGDDGGDLEIREMGFHDFTRYLNRRWNGASESLKILSLEAQLAHIRDEHLRSDLASLLRPEPGYHNTVSVDQD